MSVLAYRAWRDPSAWIWAAMAITLIGTLLTGISSSEQLQYLPLLGPVGAVMIARGLDSIVGRRLYQWSLAVVVICCLIRGGRVAWNEVDRVSEIVSDQAVERSIDLAVERSTEGDTLWLVAPANQADDDKTATAPALWRLSPIRRMPMVYPVPFEYRDYRYGQPRAWMGRIVHTSTELYAGPFDAVAAASLAGGHRIWVVLYEHEHAAGLTERVERVLRPYDVERTEVPVYGGVEQVYRVQAVLDPGAEE